MEVTRDLCALSRWADVVSSPFLSMVQDLAMVLGQPRLRTTQRAWLFLMQGLHLFLGQQHVLVGNSPVSEDMTGGPCAASPSCDWSELS